MEISVVLTVMYKPMVKRRSHQGTATTCDYHVGSKPKLHPSNVGSKPKLHPNYGIGHSNNMCISRRKQASTTF